MGKVKLGNYLTEYSVKNKKNKKFPVYSVTNSNGFCTDYFNKDVSSENKTTYKIVPYGYFAYNPSRINVGSIACQECEEFVIVSPLYTVFKSSNDINRKYLMFFLKSDFGMQLINTSVSGSVRANLKFKTLCNFEITERTLEEQEKAILIFERINNIIENCENQLKLYDEMIKSKFNQLFSKFDKINLSEIADIIMGQSPESSAYNDVGEGLPFFQGKADYGDKYTITKHYTCKWSKVAKKGYVLMSVRAPVGPVNIASEECAIGRGLCAINAKTGKANNEFIYNALNSMQSEIILSGKDGSTFASINKEQVYMLQLPLAPISIQDEFSGFVHSIDQLKNIVLDKIKRYKELLNKKIDEFYK